MLRLPLPALAGLALAGCTTPPSPPPAPVVNVAPAPAITSARPTPPPDAPPPKAALWRKKLDWDNDGNAEWASLHHDGRTATLRVGEASATLPWRGGEPFGGISVHVIDIDAVKGGKEILLRQRAEGEIDPPFVHWVAFYDRGRLVLQKLWHNHGYNAGVFKLDGDGWLRTHYDECPDEITVHYQLDGMRLVERSREHKRTGKPENCAACPVVYLHDGRGWSWRGEVLRDLDGPTLATWQPLPLRRAIGARRTVTILLREEKREVTHLDAIALDIAGRRLRPDACSRTPAPAYCKADGRAHRMQQGDTLALRFALPPATRPGDATLWAKGHYVRLPDNAVASPPP